MKQYIMGTNLQQTTMEGGLAADAVFFWSRVNKTPISYANRHERIVSAQQDGFCYESGTLRVHEIIDRSSP